MALPMEINKPVAQPAAIQTFHRFSRFPAEIRLKIWRCALPASKILEIEWCNKAETWLCSLESLSPFSGLAFTNTEARNVYLKHYQPFLHPSTSSYGANTCNHDFGRKTMAYFDPKVDIVYIGASSESEYCFCPAALKALKELLKATGVDIVDTTIACELSEWADGIREYGAEPHAVFGYPREFLLVWGDVNYSAFENEGRPEGEIGFVELTEEEEDSDRALEVEDFWGREVVDREMNREVERQELPIRVKIPSQRLVRVRRGEDLMSHEIGI